MNDNRILIITPKFGKNSISQIILEIVNNITGFNYEIAADFFDKADIPKNIKTYDLPDQENVFSYFFSINKIVRENDYKMVYIHANSALMIVETLACKLANSAKVITHCHTSATVHPFWHRLLKPFFNFFPDKKIACSDVSAAWAYRGKNIFVIPNGINMEKFRFSSNKRREIRLRLNLEDKTIVGNFGRLSKLKNQSFLLDIFNEYRKIRQNAFLLLLDDGDMCDQIRGKIDQLKLTDKVLLLEYSNNINEYYNALDVMVMPSLSEGLSLMALEAQANGLPLMITENLSSLTYITGYAHRFSLRESPKFWANKIDEIISGDDRGNYTPDLFEKAGVTKAQMLNQIKHVLND